MAKTGLGPVPQLNTAEDVRAVLEQTVNDVRVRRIDSKTVASMCQIANTFLRAIEVSRERLSAPFLTARFQARADMDCGALAPS